MLGDRIFEVHYEDMVSDTEETVRGLLEFCGLVWDPECLELHKNKRFVHTANYQQVREPIYTRSIGLWHKYAMFLNPMIKELGGLCQ